MILAILAILCITISHSSLYCFTSWRDTHQNTGLSEEMCGTCIPHGECLKYQTRDGGDKWELGCQRTTLLENCERCLKRAHRNIIMCADLPSRVRDDGGTTWPKKISKLYIRDSEVILTSWGLIVRRCRSRPTPFFASKWLELERHSQEQSVGCVVVGRQGMVIHNRNQLWDSPGKPKEGSDERL
jgi:hypothetical protein